MTAAEKELLTQLGRAESLYRFALEASSFGSETEVVFSALEMLSSVIAISGAAAALHAEGGLEVVLVRSSEAETFVTEPEEDDLRAAIEASAVLQREVEIFDGNGSHPAKTLLDWLDRRYRGITGAGPALRRSVVVFRLSSGIGSASDVLVIRSEAEEGDDRCASEQDLGFLQWVCKHINAALKTVRARFDLERRVEQRTLELGDANGELAKRLSELKRSQAQLVGFSRRAGMADVANSVLHNVGNVLNSANVSAGLVMHTTRASKASLLQKAVGMLNSQPDPVRFIAEDPRGPKVLAWFSDISQAIQDERTATLVELEQLTKNLDHIKAIVSSQQSLAGGRGVVEELLLNELIEDALKMNAVSYQNHEVTVEREFATLDEVKIDRHKLLQILINLLSNAKQAVSTRVADRRITIRTRVNREAQIEIDVEDNGTGIAPENLGKIFNLGFTTKAEGHGFGLHSSACSALELGGRLTVGSEGIGLGARFTLVVPREPHATVLDTGPTALPW